MHTDARLDGNRDRRTFEDLIQKLLQPIRDCQKAGPAFAGGDGGGGAAEIQIQVVIAKILRHNARHGQEIIGLIGQDLDNHVHARIIFFADIFFLFFAKMSARDKRGKIGINA